MRVASQDIYQVANNMREVSKLKEKEAVKDTEAEALWAHDTTKIMQDLQGLGPPGTISTRLEALTKEEIGRHNKDVMEGSLAVDAWRAASRRTC